jgi:hypothetical protein
LLCVPLRAAQGVSERRLGALSALIKVQATRTLDFCAREASQVRLRRPDGPRLTAAPAASGARRQLVRPRRTGSSAGAHLSVRPPLVLCVCAGHRALSALSRQRLCLSPARSEVRVNAIGGGSEEIMLDLAVRQSKL